MGEMKTAKGQKGQRGKQGEKKRTVRKPKTAAGGPGLKIKQVRSGIGHAETYRRTLRALGLKHHQDEVVVPDNPSTRGMVFKVRHLVRVAPVEA